MWPQSLCDSWHLTNKKLLTPSTSLLLYNIRSQSCFTSGRLFSIFFFLSGVALNVILIFFSSSALLSLQRTKSAGQCLEQTQKLSPSYSVRSLKLTVLSLILLSLSFIHCSIHSKHSRSLQEISAMVPDLPSLLFTLSWVNEWAALKTEWLLLQIAYQLPHCN